MAEFSSGEELRALDERYLASTYARYPLEISEGIGSIAYDERGRSYIDLGAGIAVNTFGYADPAWVGAVSAQLQRVQHTSNLYYTEPQARLAQMLCERTGARRVFFCNSGAEANEAAIKAARKYSSDKYGEGSGRSTIVCLTGSFHGRTVTTLSATGQEKFHRHFAPFTTGFVFVSPNDIDGMRAALSDPSVCAVMMELIQGEGGVNPLSRDFVEESARLASARDILLVLDEVQTGNGRTGQLYCYENYGVTPDIFTTAKGLGGGLPIGACLFGEKTASVLGRGDHGSTFGGNPAVCAGAVSILERIDEECLAGVRERGEFIRRALTGAPGVRLVTGMGLMVGVEPEGRTASDVASECLARGVLVLTAGSRVRLLPALNIPQAELETGISILRDVLAGK